MGHNFFVGISYTSWRHAVATFEFLRSHSIRVGVPKLKKSVCFCNFLSYWTCCFVQKIFIIMVGHLLAYIHGKKALPKILKLLLSLVIYLLLQVQVLFNFWRWDYFF